MDYERSKRLGKILESANQFEIAQRRRARVSSSLWIFLIILILIGMFFAGRAWYSLRVAPASSHPEPNSVQSGSMHDAAHSQSDTSPLTAP
jgi:H+/Cl- antiporter ClcA